MPRRHQRQRFGRFQYALGRRAGRGARPVSRIGTQMSRSYPIISIPGSPGAGTTSVKKTFENIFRREKVAAAYVEGDAFHRYNRAEMRTKMAEKAERGDKHFSHFIPETNRFEELEKLFRDYGESGTGTVRHYVHVIHVHR